MKAPAAAVPLQGAGLTRKQRLCLEFIAQSLSQNGVSPSFQEIMEHMGLSSKSGVHRLLKALEERGHIYRCHHRARAISLAPFHTVDGSIHRLLDSIEHQAKAMKRGNIGAANGGESILSMITNYRKGVRI